MIALLFLLIVSSSASALYNFPPRQLTWGDCDPIAPDECLSPFPNSFYLVEDAATPTGYRTNFTKGMMFGGKIDPVAVRANTFDGAGTGAAIIVVLPSIPHVATAATWANISLSLDVATTSPTVLLAVSGGGGVTVVPHWVEVDTRSPDDTRHATLLIHPAAILTPSTRYIVALKTSLGFTPSVGYAALRDNTTTTLPSISDRRSHFESIFALLLKAGVRRADTLLSWDFLTMSDATITAKVLAMRRDALSRLPPKGVKYSITQIVPNQSPLSLRVVHGTMEVPLYLDSPSPGSKFVLDRATGLPLFQGFTNVTFVANVPVSARGPKPYLQAGHGLFGDMTEILSPYFQGVSNDTGCVTASLDWWGLSKSDEVVVAAMVALNLTDFNIVPDRLQQAMVNHMYLTKLMTGAIVTDPSFVGYIDPSMRHYTGDSLGGILGASFLAISPDINRGVLGVAGASWDTLLIRSKDFAALWDVLALVGFTPPQRVIALALVSNLCNFVTPEGYLRHLVDEPLDGNAPKEVFMQNGLGDQQVSTMAAYTFARTVRASVFSNTLSDLPGALYSLPIVSSPYTMPTAGGGVLLQIWSFGSPPIPFGDQPPSGPTDTHTCTRNDPRAIAQLEGFLSDGVVTDHCGGVGCTVQPNSPCHYS